MEEAAIYARAGWFQATARQRIAGLLDPNSFTEFLGPSERIQSPHLHLFDLPSAFDDGVIIGRGKLDGKDVLVAAQEGQFMGGTFAEVSGAKIVGLVRAARDHKNLPQTILLLLDSGGVRLQEANAGELVVAELMRAIVQARSAGVAVIALIGGKAGAFGGAGLTADNVQADAAGIVIGTGKREQGGAMAVIGVANGAALGTAGVLPLAQEVLRVVADGGNIPILVVVDTQGQLMARRDEMRGLNEYLAHLAKCLLLASQEGHRTIGLEYGKAAAGAFLATALATDFLIGLPGAEPVVMDLPSMSRVTKLPMDKLIELAKATPVFAPGLDHLAQMGAVAEIWDPQKPLDEQLEEALKKASPVDTRDELGAMRKGRPMAAKVAKRVIAEATGRGGADVASA